MGATFYNLDAFLDAYKAMKREDGALPRWGGLSFYSDKLGKVDMDLGPEEFDRILSAINQEKR